jgi:hypothetical protein
MEQPDLGGEIAAFLREGAKDLHNAIVPAFPDSQRGVDEIGTPLTPTQYMVNQDLNAYEQQLDASASLGHGDMDRGLER